jgi:hypothetical protein
MIGADRGASIVSPLKVSLSCRDAATRPTKREIRWLAAAVNTRPVTRLRPTSAGGDAHGAKIFQCSTLRVLLIVTFRPEFDPPWI